MEFSANAGLAENFREVMGVGEASEYLGVSPTTLYKYLYERKIPAFKFGKRWKFKKTVLDRWMEIESTRRRGKGSPQS